MEKIHIWLIEDEPEFVVNAHRVLDNLDIEDVKFTRTDIIEWRNYDPESQRELMKAAPKPDVIILDLELSETNAKKEYTFLVETKVLKSDSLPYIVVWSVGRGLHEEFLQELLKNRKTEVTSSKSNSQLSSALKGVVGRILESRG